MRYLLLIGSENKTAAPPSPAEGQAMVQAFMRFSEEVRAAGKTVVAERLRPEDEASRVRVKAGQRQVMAQVGDRFTEIHRRQLVAHRNPLIERRVMSNLT